MGMGEIGFSTRPTLEDAPCLKGRAMSLRKPLEGLAGSIVIFGRERWIVEEGFAREKMV